MSSLTDLRHCPICDYRYQFDLQLLRDGKEARLPMTCTPCGYTICYECAKFAQVRYLQDRKTLPKGKLPKAIACLLCKAKNSFVMTENPSINRRDCLQLAQWEKQLPHDQLQQEKEEEEASKRSANLQAHSRTTVWEEVQVNKAANADDIDEDGSANRRGDNNDEEGGDELNQKLPARRTRSQSARANSRTIAFQDNDESEVGSLRARVALTRAASSSIVGIKDSDQKIAAEESDDGHSYDSEYSESSHVGFTSQIPARETSATTAPPIRPRNSNHYHRQKEYEEVEDSSGPDLNKKNPARCLKNLDEPHPDMKKKTPARKLKKLHKPTENSHEDEVDEDRNNNDSKLNQKFPREEQYLQDRCSDSYRKAPAKNGRKAHTSMASSESVDSSSPLAAVRATERAPEEESVINLMESDSEEEEPNPPHKGKQDAPTQQNAPNLAKIADRTAPHADLQVKRHIDSQGGVHHRKKQRQSTAQGSSSLLTSSGYDRPKKGESFSLPPVVAKHSGWDGFNAHISNSNLPKSFRQVLELMDFLFRVERGEESFYLALYEHADSPAGSGQRKGLRSRVQLRDMKKRGKKQGNYSGFHWHADKAEWAPPTKEHLRTFIKTLVKLKGAPELAAPETFD